MKLLTSLNAKRRVESGFLLTLVLLITGMPLSAAAFSAAYAKLPPYAPPAPHHLKPEAPLSKGKFLVATEQMKDPRFSETVVLLIDYGVQGAVGLIINRPTHLRLSAALPGVSGLDKHPDTVYFGGPVETGRMLLLIRSKRRLEESQNVFGDIYVSSSLNALKRILSDKDPGEDFRIYAGYAGWAPGQLDQEASLGGWRVLEADAEAVFDKKPSEVWPRLTNKP